MSKSIKLTFLIGLLAITLLMLSLSALRLTGNIQMDDINNDVVAATEIFKTECISESADDCFIEQEFQAQVSNSILQIGTDNYNLSTNEQQAEITLFENEEGIVVQDDLENLLNESASEPICVNGSYLFINKLTTAAVAIAYEYEEGKTYIELSRCSDQLTIDNHYLLLSNFDQI